MGDDDLHELRRRLDLLISIHQDIDGVAIAETLFALANGVLATHGARPRWIESEQVVEIPFVEASELEAHLEGLLSTRVICFHVEGCVPLLRDLRVRIVAGRESVMLTGRAVQQTAAGVVIQLQPADVDVQRALVGLPGALRSNPTEPLKVDRKAVRIPCIVPREEAEKELFGEPAPPAPAAPAAPAYVAPAPTPPPAEPVPEPEPPVMVVEPGLSEPTDADAEDRVRNSRLAFQLPKVEAALSRAGNRNHFEFLAVHFSADSQDCAQARAALLELIEQCRTDDSDGELAGRLDRLAARLDEAWKVLERPDSRRKHRGDVIGQFQIDTALEMFEQQAEAAKLSRRVDTAIECYRRLIELAPGNAEARHQLAALERLAE